MDLKEIIKWFIPCFHILLVFRKLMDFRLTLCLFLLFNSGTAKGAKLDSVDSKLGENNLLDETKNVDLIHEHNLINQSDYLLNKTFDGVFADSTSSDVFVGRTFGRPLKKMMQALIPLAFQIGAASTWAVVAAIVGFKTLLVALVILKLLLLAGAAKVGALFAAKGHHHHEGWQPPHQKEIHLHIHNGQHGVSGGYEEHIPAATWSRDGASEKPIDISFDPYSGGPQTINTPYGNYMKIDPN